MRRILFMFILLGCGGQASAGGYYTGRELLEVCEDAVYHPALTCLDYIESARNPHWNGWEPADPKICVPKTVPSTRLKATIVKYLKSHRPDLPQYAGALVLKAFNAAYPCPE